MPRYGYICDECGREWEHILPIVRRRESRCKNCGRKGRILISPETSTRIFKPMWYRDICETPLWIESRSQLREECRKHDVTAARLL